MAVTDNWLRPEFQDRPDELITRTEYEEQRDLPKGTISARFRDYADRKPKVVLERARQDFFAVGELDDFLEKIGGHRNQRTSAEVTAAEVVRREEAVTEHQGRVEKKKAELAARREELKKKQEGVKKKEEELEKAQRQLKYHQGQLEAARQKLHIETHGR